METKKDALTGVRLGAFARIVACSLTFLLAAGMVPAGAIAYAAEQGDSLQAPAISDEEQSSSDRVNEDMMLDTSGASGDSSVGESGSDDEGAVMGASGSGSASDAAEGESTSSGANRYTSSANGQTSADVSLTGDATVGTIEYNGLAYTIDPDDPTAVALTGLASSAPKGDIVVPSQIASGNKLYTVAEIARGGGYLR